MRPKNSTRVAAATPSTTIPQLAASYRLHLQAENKSLNTIAIYLSALDRFCEYLTASGRVLDASKVTQADVQGFMTEMLKTYAPASASNRFRSLKTFFKWAVDEGEAALSPMERMKPPTVPASPPDVLSESDIKTLLSECSGRYFEDLRDTAIIRLFLATGCRRAEVGGLTVKDVDLESLTVTVLGKGSRLRSVPFDPETALSLDRYIRKRKQHRDALKPNLWLGHSGPMTDSGVYQVVRDRALAAGIGHVYCHQLRHTWAHRMLAMGHTEGDTMQIAGWNSRQMVSRYGASAANARAHDAYRKHNPMEGI